MGAHGLVVKATGSRSKAVGFDTHRQSYVDVSGKLHSMLSLSTQQKWIAGGMTITQM